SVAAAARLPRPPRLRYHPSTRGRRPRKSVPSRSSEERSERMSYDLLIKDGRIIDGSGRPAFHGDVAVAGGKIVELGRLGGTARQVIEADGRAIAPGFVDNHCHYDAQVAWDPLCTYSCHHGATTVIIGNCSLALAPVKPAARE